MRIDILIVFAAIAAVCRLYLLAILLLWIWHVGQNLPP